MNKLIEWLKQARTELDNILTQRRLDKQWEKYQDEVYTMSMLPVVKRAAQGKSAAELTAKMWVEIVAAGIVDKVIDDNVTPDDEYKPVKIVVRRRNMETYRTIMNRYTVQVKEL